MKIKLLELIQTKLGERVEISFLAQKTGISKFKLSKLIHELKMELEQKLCLNDFFVVKRGVIQKQLGKKYFLLDRLCEDVEILKNFFDVFIITDGRLLFEFEELKRRFPEIKIIHVIRENYDNHLTENEKRHVTEIEMEDYKDYDYIVRNTSKERLYSEADKIMGLEANMEGEVI